MWYLKKLSGYSPSLEDAIFCNDRYISSLGNWDPSGPITYSSCTNLQFRIQGHLDCINETDKYSMENTKAELIYPVALPTYYEMYLLTSNIIRSAGTDYLIDKPMYFTNNYAVSTYVTSSGAMYSSNSNANLGIRPVISLLPGTEYSSGNGSMANPYYIDAILVPS